MRKLLLVAALMFSCVGISHADIFNPVGQKSNEMITLSAPAVSNSSTLLNDTVAVVKYLGLREGFAYQFNQHKFVSTTGATIISYAPWHLALGATMLATNGVVGDLDWNIGSYFPVAKVPIMKYVKYLYIF